MDSDSAAEAQIAAPESELDRLRTANTQLAQALHEVQAQLGAVTHEKNQCLRLSMSLRTNLTIVYNDRERLRILLADLKRQWQRRENQLYQVNIYF
jgi:predicted  nucleic acid-binding Zn-ribbon protein